jgi:hypothetical protein
MCGLTNLNVQAQIKYLAKFTASEGRPKGRASETAPPSCDVVVDIF